MNQTQLLEITLDGKVYQVDSAWLRQNLRRFSHVNRKHKDRLFIRLFHDPEKLLQLYNAVNHSNYQNPADLTITTLEDAVYLGMKNDCSFLIGNYLNLYEHQSSFNPNMPLRGFLYFAELLKNELDQRDANIYGSKLIKIPTPRYVVFYNGADHYPDSMDLNLSNAFKYPGGCMEFTTTMLNINLGHNSELMEHCQTLGEYSQFIDKIRWYQNKGYSQSKSIDAAVRYCIKHGILETFLRKNMSEVKNLILTEYNEKKHMDYIREEGRNERQATLFKLMKFMVQDGLEKSLPKLYEDEHFLNEMLEKYGLQ